MGNFVALGRYLTDEKIKNNGLREAVVSDFRFFVFEHFFYSGAIPILVAPLMAVNTFFV